MIEAWLQELHELTGSHWCLSCVNGRWSCFPEGEAISDAIHVADGQRECVYAAIEHTRSIHC